MKRKSRVAAIVLALVLALGMTGTVFGATNDSQETKWSISKSKTATNLDSNFESQITLSLPAEQEELASDIVFVLDKSTSADVEQAAIDMLEELACKEASIKVGVVIFNKEANAVMELTELDDKSVEDAATAIRTEIKSGTNTHAGLIAGKAMLDGDTTVSADRKYLVFVSDGITYMYNSNPTFTAWSFNNPHSKDDWHGPGSWATWAGPDNWYSKYHTNDMTDWNWKKCLADIGEQVKKQGTEYEYPYGGTATKATPEDIDKWDTDYAMSIDKALYLTWEEYSACISAGYNCYALNANSTGSEGNPWGPSFMKYLANGKGVSFEQIKKDIIYLVDSGSYVVDEIGKTADYDFDFINDINKLKLTIGGAEIYGKAIPGTDNKYGFGDQQENGKYWYELTYYKDGYEVSDVKYGECFVWDINVPVTIDKQVQLTYSVKLTNPKTAAGTYGEYDRDGSQGKAALYTNNSAVLYPIDSNRIERGLEYFNKPTVSYTVAAGQEDITDPTDASDVTDEEAAAEDAVKTGDTISMVMLVALILAMVGGAVVLITRKRRSI